ncbi:GNAT family N-acetyltransferase [Jeotgalibacillus proteolyticus]|uniref:N-acetyltransferase n=1 Tax=Jeotgalibacillus proteolyticus TaxID=2082395 RepID=A0A2S5GE29_9BACL|nr:GNAT family N-acetyltransferase [Jeotgalibacillus proteolyticus]PPA71143.1 N-acetyltransferase [Jeotgalibacillus proteolyticus]
MDKDEIPFLLEMLYESIHIPENKPPLNELLASEGLKKYSQHWGRPGDEALVAVDRNNILLGAIWYRLFSSEEPGYGFVNEATPEIGMAVTKEARGKGLGSLLMKEAIRLAQEQGYSALSLSVDPENVHAVMLYKKYGFTEVGLSGTSITMKCTFPVKDKF